MKTVNAFLFIFLLTLLAAQTTLSQRTVKVNLEQMVEKSGMIVRGTVAKVYSGTDNETQMIATFVTIDVQENFYGATQQQITIKMVGGKGKNKTVKLAEMPSFNVGEDVVVLMHAPSKLGFTSPVGMGQGKFLVQRDESAQTAYVRNASGNKNLFDGIKHLSALSKKDIPQRDGEKLTVDELSQSIRSLVTILKK